MQFEKVFFFFFANLLDKELTFSILFFPAVKQNERHFYFNHQAEKQFLNRW